MSRNSAQEDDWVSTVSLKDRAAPAGKPVFRGAMKPFPTKPDVEEKDLRIAFLMGAASGIFVLLLVAAVAPWVMRMVG